MSKKLIIIVAIFFAIIITALTVGYILYLTTDLFKSNSEIFQRHFAQSLNTINSITDFSSEQNYINTLTRKNYTDNTKIIVNYQNSQGITETFNITTDGIKNAESKNTYRKINVKFGDSYDVLNAEYLREDQMYGIHFSEIVKQFASIDASNLDLVLKKININKADIEKYNIQDNWNLFLNKRNDLEKVCIDFATEISKMQYTKQKESTITLSNGEQINTTELNLKLTGEQVKKLLFNIFREIEKQDLIDDLNKSKTEFKEASISLNVIKDKTFRMLIDYDKIQLRIDFYDNELNIKYTELDTEEVKTYTVNLKNQDEKKFIDYEDSYSNKIKLELGEGENTANIQASIQNNNIKQLDFSIDQKLEISESSIEITKKFETEPNVLLSKLNVNGINGALDSLLKLIDKKIRQKNNDINSEILQIWLNQNNALETGFQGQKEREKNSFNNQFKSYEGIGVEKNLIYNMLDAVSRNIIKYEKVSDEKIIIYVKPEEANKEMTQEIKELIEKDYNKFDIKFQYNSKGRINAIIMEKSKVN